MSVNLEDYQQLYLQTAQELLERLKVHLVALEINTNDNKSIAEFHRAAHSLKGQSLVMNYTQLGLAARILESLFNEVQNGHLNLTKDLLILIQDAVEQMQSSLDDIKGKKGEKDLSEVIKKIEENANVTLLS